jgi:hypothetical protein
MSQKTILSCSLSTGYFNKINSDDFELDTNWDFLKKENDVSIYTNSKTFICPYKNQPKDQIWLKVINHTENAKKINLDIRNYYKGLGNILNQDEGFLEIEIPGDKQKNNPNPIIRVMRNIKENIEKIYQYSKVDDISIQTI